MSNLYLCLSCNESLDMDWAWCPFCGVPIDWDTMTDSGEPEEEMQ